VQTVFGGGWLFGILGLILGGGSLVFRRSLARRMARERTQNVRDFPWLRFFYGKAVAEPGVRRELLGLGVIWTAWGVASIMYELFWSS
jgi:hypothetical protein